MILLAWCTSKSPLYQHKSFMAYSSLVLAKKVSKKGKKMNEKKKKNNLVFGNCCPIFTAEDSTFILTPGEYVNTAR